MKKIELKVSKFGFSGLCVIIKHQDKKIKNNIIYSDGRLSIRSYNRPELTKDSFYVRGKCSEHDHEPVFEIYESRSERDEMYNFIVKAAKVINSKKR